MLFKLMDSIADIALDAKPKSAVAIENLLGSAFEGAHIVLASGKLLRKLSKCVHLSERSRVTAKTLLSRNFESGELERLVGYRIVVDDQATQATTNEKEAVVPLSVFEKTAVSGVPLLLCENLLDCHLYVHAARHYAILRNASAIIVQAEPTNGGGAETGNVYQQILSRRERFALCITDSDRSHPDAALGEVAKGCEKVSKSINWPTRHRPLRARAVENVIPLAFFYAADGVDQFGKTMMSEISNSPGSEILKFIDLKKGATLKSIIEASPDGSKGARFWKAHVAKMGRFSQSAGECIANWNCSSRGDCSCVLFCGLGPKAASSVAKWLGGRTPHKALEAFARTDADEWLSIGELVFDWCCASKPVRL